MTAPITYPKISRVWPRSDRTLLVEFENGERRIYDCKPLLEEEAFRALGDQALFRCARADEHGYAVVWSDEVDLAESEIWLNGRPISIEDRRSE